MERRISAAEEALKQGLEFCPGAAFRSRLLGALGFVYGRWGKQSLVGDVKRELDRMRETSYVPSFELAQIEIGTGNSGGALACLEHAVINGVRIRYVEKGTGEPVLLIHGYTRNLETNWVDTGVFENLARNHHVIAFDLRGHGKSGKPHDPGAYGREFVQDALRLLDHLQIRRAHIVGYSLGSTIAAKLLTTDPGRFLTVTLGASGGSRNWVPEDDQIGERNAAELEGDAPFRRLVIALTPRDAPKRTEADIRAQSEAWAAMNDIKALAAYNRGGMRELEATDEEMSAVKVPVLGVVGSVDAALRGLKELQTILPSMRLVVIDGATHAGERSAARRPEFVNAIREFIASHRQINSR